MKAADKAPLVPLFWVSLGTIGYEICITRYFAIASWSEYGYWVISIAMVGFAVSGVILSLFGEFFLKRWPLFLFAIPSLLVILASAGFYLTTINPFNPLEFQNPDAWLDQLLNIGKYYGALFPVFFLAGVYVGLCFLAFQQHIPTVYAVDLAGAAAGALLALVLMFWVHPFYLLTALLPCFALAAVLSVPGSRTRKRVAALAAVALLLASEIFIVALNKADFNQYKSIYPALHVPDSKVVKRMYSPRGLYMVLDNFTERLDTDFSNNLGSLSVSEPPRAYGLYKDGQRIAALPSSGSDDSSYVKAALDALPYEMVTAPRVLLIGTRGGFRIREALALGAASMLALEPSATVFQLVSENLQAVADTVLQDSRIALSQRAPAAQVALGEQFDLVDIASDFLDQADANKFAFTMEAVQGYFAVLSENGLISIPISMRELTVYAVKMLETARRALADAGVAAPERHLLVYRSAWNARIVVSKRPFSAAQIERLRSFCERLSFDTAYFPGIEPTGLKIWNDLPAVSFDDQAVTSPSSRAADALMEDALQLLSTNGDAFLKQHFFNLEPSTYDRPSFFSILRLANLRNILDRIAIIPREELGTLINLAVLAQALVLALIVLSLPLIRWRRQIPGAGVILKSILYFAGLGLGFLFLEILLIEKVSFFLDDRTYAFTIVLSGMLVFSGMGSFVAGNYLADPRRGIKLAVAIICVWTVLAMALLDAVLFTLLELPFALKCAAVIAILAPLSFALGFPFPLGLYLFRGKHSNFLPWAWSLNGAFSVIATPLANLLALSSGYTLILLLSLACYVAVYLSFPVTRGQNQLA